MIPLSLMTTSEYRILDEVLLRKKESVIVKYLVNKVFSSCKINVRLFIYNKCEIQSSLILREWGREYKRRRKINFYTVHRPMDL